MTSQRADVPAALGQLKGLRKLSFSKATACSFEAGCLELPNLLSLDFLQCFFGDAEVLPSVTALQCLTRIECTHNKSPWLFDPKLTQLGLHRIVMSDDVLFGTYRMHEQFYPGLLRLPADMGVLRLSLLHLQLSGLRVTRFPIVLTQVVALEHLDASGNAFTKLPGAIMALSRLKELRLGQNTCKKDPLQLHKKRPLDACALGDLSGFPALRELTFSSCEVMLCSSMLGAVHHASLTALTFRIAHPAPECAPAVLQLSRALWGLGRGSVVKCEALNWIERVWWRIDKALEKARGRAPCQVFKAALEAYKGFIPGLTLPLR